MPFFDSEMPNPKVFLSVSINNQPPKHLTIEIYADTTPTTAARFHSLFTGRNISQLHYKNSTFHRILRKQEGDKVTALCQGGTLPNASRKEIQSVFGIGTKEENFVRKHDGFGTVSMVSPRGPQFFILTDVSEKNDGKYVVVGRVVEGLDVVREIAGFGSFTGETLASVVIVDCGMVRSANPITITPSEPASGAVQKCLHCGTTNTPQWRSGPLGPKTLCNACGMCYRSGQLLPQYRPAASPSFDPAVHTNSHGKATK